MTPFSHSKTTVVGILAALLFVPFAFLHAETLADILLIFVEIFNMAVFLFMVLSILFFIMGAIKLIYGASDTARAEAKQQMIWGSLALAVMVAVWGLVEVITTTFFETL